MDTLIFVAKREHLERAVAEIKRRNAEKPGTEHVLKFAIEVVPDGISVEVTKANLSIEPLTEQEAQEIGLP